MSLLAMYDKGIALKGWMHDRQIIVNGQKLTKRKCRTWVQCAKCGVDIRATDKERRYWETSGHYRLCIKCMLEHLEKAEMIKRL
jgi:cysteinyl-tRNA synthetase